MIADIAEASFRREFEWQLKDGGNVTGPMAHPREMCPRLELIVVLNLSLLKHLVCFVEIQRWRVTLLHGTKCKRTHDFQYIIVFCYWFNPFNLISAVYYNNMHHIYWLWILIFIALKLLYHKFNSYVRWYWKNTMIFHDRPHILLKRLFLSISNCLE